MNVVTSDQPHLLKSSTKGISKALTKMLNRVTITPQKVLIKMVIAKALMRFSSFLNIPTNQPWGC